MSIRDSFCPKCGKPSETEGLCRQCRIGNTPWFTCDNRIKNVQCPSCGATKQVNTWTDSTRGRDELGPELAKSAVHFHPDVKKPMIEVVVEDLTVNRSVLPWSSTGPCTRHQSGDLHCRAHLAQGAVRPV